MAGVKGRSGGARPGAGAKRKETVEMQGNRRDIVLDVVSQRIWRETITEWIETARATGNFALLFPLLPYIMGAAKSELHVSGQVEHTLTISEIRQAIGITEVRPLKALKSG
jgi:hypothetical protein